MLQSSVKLILTIINILVLAFYFFSTKFLENDTPTSSRQMRRFVVMIFISIVFNFMLYVKR
jgi:hypothetical protein